MLLFSIVCFALRVSVNHLGKKTTFQDADATIVKMAWVLKAEFVQVISTVFIGDFRVILRYFVGTSTNASAHSIACPPMVCILSGALPSPHDSSGRTSPLPPPAQPGTPAG